MIEEKKRYIAFYFKRKYEGEVLEVTELFVKVNDMILGEVILPIGSTVFMKVNK